MVILKRKRFILLIVCFGIFSLTIALPASGALDPILGVVTYNGKNNSEDWAIKVALQKDGKIVVVGTTYNGFNWDILILRYNKKGTLDSTFGTGGVVTYNGTANHHDEGQGVAIQPDGKIVVVGHSFNGSKWVAVLLRYISNGTLDSTFGTGGVVTYNRSSPVDLSVEGHGVAIQPDGKIVVLGDTMDLPYWNANWDVILIRYNSNGTLDNTFGTGGAVTYNGPANGVDWMPGNGNSLALQKDGKIVVVGSSYNWIQWDVLLLRYNSNGTLDNTFGIGGAVTYNSPANSDDYGNAVALQGDGKIVVVGESFRWTSYWDALLLRFNSNGTLDNSFGTGGAVIYNGPGNNDDYANGVALQKDGKIVVVGESYNWTSLWDALVLRYSTNGTLDNTFGTGGVVTYNGPAKQDDCASDLVIQKNRIIVVGCSHNGVNDDVLIFVL